MAFAAIQRESCKLWPRHQGSDWIEVTIWCGHTVFILWPIVDVWWHCNLVSSLLTLSWRHSCNYHDVTLNTVMTSLLTLSWRPSWQGYHVTLDTVMTSLLTLLWRHSWHCHGVTFDTVLTSLLTLSWRHSWQGYHVTLHTVMTSPSNVNQRHMAFIAIDNVETADGSLDYHRPRRPICECWWKA